MNILPKSLPKEIKRDFINFLKVNRIYSAFKKNRIIQDLDRPKIESWYKITRKENLVHGFIFHETPEKVDFWWKIHSKWTEYCRRNY